MKPLAYVWRGRDEGQTASCNMIKTVRLGKDLWSSILSHHEQGNLRVSGREERLWLLWSAVLCPDQDWTRVLINVVLTLLDLYTVYVLEKGSWASICSKSFPFSFYFYFAQKCSLKSESCRSSGYLSVTATSLQLLSMWENSGLLAQLSSLQLIPVAAWH